MAKTISVTVKGTKALQRALKKAGKGMEKALGAAFYQEGEGVMSESKREVPADLGTLRASGHVRPPETTMRGVSVTLGYGGAAAAYALFVHEGTGPAVGRAPYFPPPSALEGWAKRHGIDNTFLLARAIGRRGTKPNPYLGGPLKRAERGMAGRIAKRVRRATGA